METKQGSLETKMGRGEVKVRVPVWGCTECNIGGNFVDIQTGAIIQEGIAYLCVGTLIRLQGS